MAFVAIAVSAHARRRLAVSLWHRCFATELDRWQRRCDRLTQLQRRIHFPWPATFGWEGQSWSLPVKAAAAARSPSQEELEYLVGFFDGDGCVTMSKSTGQIQLAITQNIDSAAVLVHFRSMLGGGIYRHKQATGSAKATLSWRVTGSKMMNAATVLSTVPSVKQAQLQIAAKGCVSDSDRQNVGKQLQFLKQPDHVPPLGAECSWPYLAGFFDAEGSITVEPVTSSLKLRMKQLNPYVLVRLQHFLHRRELVNRSFFRDAAGYCSLNCSDVQVCKQTLEPLLRYGLQVKRRQARLALALNKENHLRTRDAISALNGLQKRYQRLDEAGVARAKEVLRLQNSTYGRSGPELVALHQQLDELRAQHQLQKLISRCGMLRKDVRQALQQGGRVAPRDVASSGYSSKQTGGDHLGQWNRLEAPA